MARVFASASSQYVETDNATVTGVPCTMSAWVNYSRTTSGNAVALMLCTTLSGSDYLGLSCYGGGDSGTTYTLNQIARDTSANINNYVTNTVPVSTWAHICGVFASATSRTAYLNGVGKNTSTTSVTPASINRTSIGRLGRGVANPTFYFDGNIAHAAIWNVALTDNEVAALAGGADPRTIQSSSLKNYVPMTDNASPETDTQQNGYTFAVTGATFDSYNGPSGRNPYVQRSRINAAPIRSASY